MLLESREIDQIAVQREGRHLVTDFFLRSRHRFSDRSPDFFENLLHFIGEACNVIVDAFRTGLLSFHAHKRQRTQRKAFPLLCVLCVSVVNCSYPCAFSFTDGSSATLTQTCTW